ncbi:heavy-metal-associated domain-containing protein [Nocardia thailandica]|uniref:Heavy-metal-associated domain-containing protein n=1 Tax=Nocardia thailandica TaxID=257275 RepID=A0ABW6PML1_9NOCA
MYPPRYDRRAAARVLADLARPGLFGPVAPPAPVRLEYRSTPVIPEPGGHLTTAQRLYLERFMPPCRPDQVRAAAHRITWTDSAGIPNTGHCDDLPVIPLAVRETVLRLWAELDAGALAARSAAVTADDRAVLEGTTTDREPGQIFRVGIEAAGRALAQHALLLADTPHRDPAGFARALRDSGIFTAVATGWFWELQASTYRRGMIPARLRALPDGTLRYTADTAATLRAMKEATIADAHRVMRRATTEEGLSTEAAIARYHDDLDLISRQYALLEPGTRPSCPAAAPQHSGGGHAHVLGAVVDHFVETFARVVAHVEAVPAGAGAGEEQLPGGPVFYVPDMSCAHCVRTITAVLTAMDIPVTSIDLASKQVVAQFRSPRNRFRAFEALRDGGYNPVEEAPAPAPGTPVG